MNILMRKVFDSLLNVFYESLNENLAIFTI